IGAESRDKPRKRRTVMQHLHALQLAQIAVTKLAPGQGKHDAIVAMQRLARFVPRERAGHAEVKQHDRRRVRRRDQPLAMPRRSPEAPPAKLALEPRRAYTAQHAAVTHHYFADARATMARQHASESLDVGQLGQSAR